MTTKAPIIIRTVSELFLVPRLCLEMLYLVALASRVKRGSGSLGAQALRPYHRNKRIFLLIGIKLKNAEIAKKIFLATKIFYR